MKTQIYLLAFVAIFSLTSCAVLKTNAPNTMNIHSAGVIQNPVLVDLDISETRVTGSATGGFGTSLENIQEYAVKDVLEKANADVLVQPKFETETEDGLTTITVTGFPATYKNFRPMKPEDAPLLQSDMTQKLSIYEQPKELQKKGRGAIAAVIILSTIIGIALILSI